MKQDFLFSNNAMMCIQLTVQYPNVLNSIPDDEVSDTKDGNSSTEASTLKSPACACTIPFYTDGATGL